MYAETLSNMQYGEPRAWGLYNTFAASEYGQALEERTRFGDFQPDWVSTELWCDLLGDDVNNLRHMKHTLGIAKRFCEVVPVDKDTTSNLLMTAAIHDMGEAIVGDVAHPSKTAETEAVEVVARRKVAKEVYGGYAGAIVLSHIEPTLDKTTERGDMFRAIEYIGYCSTGLLAGVRAEMLAGGAINVPASRKQKEQLLGGLLSLEKSVATSSLVVLKQYVEKHPLLEKVLWRSPSY